MNKENNTKETNLTKFLGIGLIFIAIGVVLSNYFLLIPISWGLSSIIYGGIISTVIYCSLSMFKNKKVLKSVLNAVGLLVSIIVIVLITLLFSSPIFKANSYKNLLPTPIEKDFNKEVTPFDISKAPIVTESTAIQVADKCIGEYSGDLGSRAHLGDLTLQNIKGQLYWVAPMEHSGFFAWKNNNSEGTPYLMVNANTKECKIMNSKILIQPNSYFSQDLERVLYSNNKFHRYTDFTFEVDDDLKPYWTASIYENTIGFSGKKVTGVAVVNAETGEVQEYSIEKAPKWIDRIQPAGLVYNNVNLRGKYIHGFSLFNNNDKTKATEGAGVVYNEGKCYYYTGITSVGKDESSLGFYLIDTRTMETTYFRMSGATESSAMKSAEGQVQNLQYTASFPILLRVENNATYFIPLQDKNKLTKMYAMVSVSDHTIIGTGETVDECKSDYLKALMGKNQLTNSTGAKESYQGIVKRINDYVNQGNTYYIMMLDNNLVVSVPLTQYDKMPLIKEGDTIKIEYIKGDNKSVIPVVSIENLSLK